MAREPTYNLEKVCPLCYSTVELFGPIKRDQWRCTNPLCGNHKKFGGYLIGDNLIDRDRVKIKVV